MSWRAVPQISPSERHGCTKTHAQASYVRNHRTHFEITSITHAATNRTSTTRALLQNYTDTPQALFYSDYLLPNLCSATVCKAPHLLRSSCSGRLSLSRIGPGLGFTQARASQSASGFYLGHQTRPTTLCRRWAVSNSLSPSLSSFPPFIYPPIDRYRSLSYM